MAKCGAHFSSNARVCMFAAVRRGRHETVKTWCWQKGGEHEPFRVLGLRNKLKHTSVEKSCGARGWGIHSNGLLSHLKCNEPEKNRKSNLINNSLALEKKQHILRCISSWNQGYQQFLKKKTVCLVTTCLAAELLLNRKTFWPIKSSVFFGPTCSSLNMSASVTVRVSFLSIVSQLLVYNTRYFYSYFRGLTKTDAADSVSLLTVCVFSSIFKSVLCFLSARFLSTCSVCHLDQRPIIPYCCHVQMFHYMNTFIYKMLCYHPAVLTTNNKLEHV